MKVSSRFKRITFAILLAIGGACTYMILASFVSKLPLKTEFIMQNGSVLGGDFIAFYTGGSLYNQSPDKLYDLFEQRKLRIFLMGDSSSGVEGELPFVYPPLVATIFGQIAKLPFSTAYYLWTICGLLSSSILVFILSRKYLSLNLPSTLLTLILLYGFLPFSMNTLMGGQFSWIGMLICCILYMLLHDNKKFLAGFIFSLSYYKPPLFFLALIVFIFTQGKKFITGFASGAILLVTCSLLSVGSKGVLGYLTLVSKYTYGQKLFEDYELPPGQGAGIFALITSLSPNMYISLAIFLPLLAFTCYYLIHKKPNDLSTSNGYLWYSGVWISSVGFSIQCIRYDLAIIYPALMLLWVSVTKDVLKPFSLVAIALITTMYGEWLVRFYSWGETVLNLSSFVFLFMLVMVFIAELFNLSRLSQKKLKERSTNAITS